MAKFDLSSYETVAERLVRFWKDNPNGRVETHLISSVDGKADQFIVHASIYKDAADEHPVATGLAEEQFGGRGPNETSPLENCETSAIGRALANWTYASDADKRPSREEMGKVERSAPTRGVPEQVRENAARGPKVTVKEDPRWPAIVKAAKADPSNEFLNDLATKGEKFGSLSEKQLGAGFNAANKVLASKPSGEMAQAKIEEAFPGAKEEFSDAPF